MGKAGLLFLQLSVHPRNNRYCALSKQIARHFDLWNSWSIFLAPHPTLWVWDPPGSALLPPLSTLPLLRRHNHFLDHEVTAKHLRGIIRGWRSELKAENSDLTLQEPNLERQLRAVFQFLYCPLAPVWPCAGFIACGLVQRGKSILCLASGILGNVACLFRRGFWLQPSFELHKSIWSNLG